MQHSGLPFIPRSASASGFEESKEKLLIEVPDTECELIFENQTFKSSFVLETPPYGASHFKFQKQQFNAAEEDSDLDNAEMEELTVVHAGQINGDTFWLLSCLRPLFWVAYYLFCCCLCSASNEAEPEKDGLLG